MRIGASCHGRLAECAEEDPGEHLDGLVDEFACAGEVFALFPDLRADPQRSAVHGGIVFIESNCTATLGRKPIHFPVCDRFVIDNGKILDRRSYSDPTSVLLTVLRRPTSWPRGLRSHISGGNIRPPLP